MSYAVRAIAFLALAQPAAASTLQTIFSFGGAGNAGFAPAGQILADHAGNVYGITTDATVGGGAIYEISPPANGGAWTGAGIYQFVVGHVGVIPSGGLAGGAGRFFAATDANNYSENYGCGSVFSLSLSSAAATALKLSHLNSAPGSGCYPDGPVNLAPNGDVFAIAGNGGKAQGGFGAIMRFRPPAMGRTHWSQQTIYSFTGKADGFYPQQPMLLSASGALYGTALASSNGRAFPTPLFQLRPPVHGQNGWNFSLIYQFPPAECADGVGQLIEDAHGVIYGPCSDNLGSGGDQPGNIFSLTIPASSNAPWTRKVLWSFSGGADGGHPQTALTLDAAGNVYGTTSQGYGTIFRLTPPAGGGTPWTETTLWNFSGSDGNMPSSPLLLTGAGTLIGTTYSGGQGVAGRVFELTP